MDENLPIPITKLPISNNLANDITNNILPPKLDNDDLSIFDDGVINNDINNNSNDNENHPEHNQYYYLVYTIKSKLVKIGITNETYEICKNKYKKIYGSIDTFNFIQVENRMTKHRLERAFYSFFIDTRLFAGKEFFSPIDSQGRDMISIYLAILKLLASNDLAYIRLFYLEHGLTLNAARKWINTQFSSIELTSSIQQSPDLEQTCNNDTNKSLLINLSALNSIELSRVDNNTMTYQKEEAGVELNDSNTIQFNDLLNQIVCDVEQININSNSLDYVTSTIVYIDQGDNISEDVLNNRSKQLFIYLVYCDRSNMVKVSYTYDSYEENFKKFTKVYGHLSSFNYISIENDILSGKYRLQWLERAFYSFFIDTRLFAGKEFFSPIDSQGRDMIPIYLAILKLLASNDLAYIRLFYLEHGLTLNAARKWINNQFSSIELATSTISTLHNNTNHKTCNIIVSPSQEDIIMNPSFPSSIDEQLTIIDL